MYSGARWTPFYNNNINRRSPDGFRNIISPQLPPIALGLHRIRNLDEPTNIRPHHQARQPRPRSVFGAGIEACLEAVLHDRLEFCVYFRGRPGESGGVLGHFEARNGYASAATRKIDFRSERRTEKARDDATYLDALPGAYQIFPSPLLAFSNTSMASRVHPILLPSATIFVPLLTSASASSPLTSFCVAHGRAMSTLSTSVHERAPSCHEKFSFPAAWTNDVRL